MDKRPNAPRTFDGRELDRLIEQTRRKRRGRRALLVLLLLLVIAAAVITAVCVLRRPAVAGGQAFTEDPAALTGTPPPIAAGSMEEQLQKKMEETSFTIQIYSKPQFADGTAEGALYILNDSENPYDLRVDITLDADGQKVYESELLHPGDGVRQAALLVDLEAGEYPATAVFVAYDRETGKSVGQAAAGIVIYVLG